MSIKGIPLSYAYKFSLSHLGLATTHILPIFPSSHRVLTSDSPHSKGPFQESSAISFDHVLRCLHYPVAAKTCQQYWGSTRFKNCSILRQPVYSPSFLPSILPFSLSLPLLHIPSTSPSSHLPHWKQIDTHKETADMSGGRRQHEEHSISRKVDIEAPSKLIVRPTLIKPTAPCSFYLLLLPLFRRQRIPSCNPVWDVAREDDCRGISFPSFSIIILHF